MGEIIHPAPVLHVVAAFSQFEEALDWGLAQACAAWGEVAFQSPRFDFTETDYYEPTMGPGLKKCFWAFEQLVDPGRLVDFKLQANDWEEQYSSLARHSCVRPLNLDPGYVTPAKLVLASTKDYAHRIYLGRGIYAEITLFYRQRAWQAHEWTFPDYRRADYHFFLNRCREYLRRQSPGHAIGDSG